MVESKNNKENVLDIRRFSKVACKTALALSLLLAGGKLIANSDYSGDIDSLDKFINIASASSTEGQIPDGAASKFINAMIAAERFVGNQGEVDYGFGYIDNGSKYQTINDQVRLDDPSAKEKIKEVENNIFRKIGKLGSGYFRLDLVKHEKDFDIKVVAQVFISSMDKGVVSGGQVCSAALQLSQYPAGPSPKDDLVAGIRFNSSFDSSSPDSAEIKKEIFSNGEWKEITKANHLENINAMKELPGQFANLIFPFIVNS